LTARILVCGAAGVEEKLPEWAALDPGENPSRGARVVLVGGAAGVAVLLVELEPGGLIALHSSPEASVCHVVEGGGTLFFESGEEIEFARGDTIEFAAGLAHGWNGGVEHTLVGVTTYPVRA